MDFAMMKLENVKVFNVTNFKLLDRVYDLDSNALFLKGVQSQKLALFEFDYVEKANFKKIEFFNTVFTSTYFILNQNTEYPTDL